MIGAISTNRSLILLALLVFTGAVGYLLLSGLHLDQRTVPSALVNQALPRTVLALPQLRLSAVDSGDHDEFIDESQLNGRVWLLNIWASWCASCVGEQLAIDSLKNEHDIIVVGLNYKDTPAKARRWLVQYGNPFDFVLSDIDGQAGIELGVYGVPETYLIDANGIVREKIVGALTEPELLERLGRQL